MNSRPLSIELQQVVQPRELPEISIILPFEPKMSAPSELEQKIKWLLSEVNENLKRNYERTKVNEMMNRLQKIVNQLDYHTHKKSLAIFLSPAVEKVYYLNVPVNEAIVIDEPFELRDVIHRKKELQPFLVLVLSGEWSRIYLGNSSKLTRMVANVPGRIDAFKNDIPERVVNFSDPSHRREVMLKKFLRYTDNGLHLLLKAHPLPLFIMGPEKLLGYFGQITKNKRNIVGYVNGNFINVTEANIREAIRPHVKDWKRVREQDLLNQIEDAANAGKLAVGIHEVLKEANRRKGRLLIIENNYSFISNRRKKSQHIFDYDGEKEDQFFISDTIDTAIEKVLESGGDVEFVEEGALKNYDRIALIQYF